MNYSHIEMLNRIKKIKKQKNLSNETLSKLSGIPFSTLSKILSGNTRDPQISNIIRISRALGVSADYIIFGNELDNSNENELLLNLFNSFNCIGKQKILDYMADLQSNSKYIFDEHNNNICSSDELYQSIRDLDVISKTAKSIYKK